MTALLAPMAHPDAAALLAELCHLVGPAHVSADPAILAHLGRTTLPEGALPVLHVRPADTAQVQAVVRWAGRHRMPFYPISRGKNWGYGDACPAREGCMLLDLSRMDRILEVNTELAYAVVEPGVTQGQLYRYLEANHIPLWMDATGAGPDASLLGNIVERGVGLSPASDRFAHACNLEVVLPDGSLVHTGCGAYDEARAAHLYRWGVGPALDGLFTQSNLGIVTRLTFWLMPKPACFRAFFIRVRDRDGIDALVEALRPIRLAGTIRCSVHCFNDMRLLGGHQRFPWDRADGREALETAHPDLTAELLHRHGIPAWLATGSLAGSPEEVAVAQRVVRRAIQRVPGARIDFVDEARLRRVGRLLGWLPRWEVCNRLRARFDKVALWVRFLQGQTDHRTLEGAGWRARGTGSPDRDPRDRGAGLIWVCPVLPMTAAATADINTLGRSIFHRFGFEYQVTLSQASDRALCAVMSIHFDRSSAAETQRAQDCHDVLVDTLVDRGYVPYRGAPCTVARLHEAMPGFWKVAGRLKHALDPDGLLAPGRYLPSTVSGRRDGGQPGCTETTLFSRQT